MHTWATRCFMLGWVVCLASSAEAQFWGVNIPIGKSAGISIGSGQAVAPSPWGPAVVPGYGYGRVAPGYYAPPVMIAPAPVQRHHYHTREVVVPSYTAPPVTRVPVVSSGSTVLSGPAVSSGPAVPRNTRPTKVYSGEPIVIANLADAGQPLRYLLNGYEYTIEPGHEQKFVEDRDWLVQFGSGGTLGDVQHSLTAGRYVFRHTDGGWDLLRQQPPKNATPSAP